QVNLINILNFAVKKLWFLHVWPSLQQEMRTQEVLAAVLQPILQLISEIEEDEYENIVLPHFRTVFNLPKSIQANMTILENIHIILDKTPSEDVTTDILPLIFAGLDSNTVQVQVAAIVAAGNAAEYLDAESIKGTVLPKSKAIYEKNPTDLSLCLTFLTCIEMILDKLERSAIIDEVLPILYDVKLQDADVTLKVINIYRMMLGDRKFGLSVNLVATRVLPALIPLTISPTLNLDQFSFLLQTIHEMLDHIDKQQRNKLKLDNLTLASPQEKRMLRHQLSSDNMNLSPFNSPALPNVRMQDSRMHSSAEDFMARRASSGPSSPDSHLLRVNSAFIGRRLSDNELMVTPKVQIRVAHSHSNASSPGTTPTGSGSLPIRRHSSIGPERRGSCVNLSPPTLARNLRFGSMNLKGGLASASKSVPMLLTPANIGNLGSRRPSACSISSFTGMDSRRSSIASISSFKSSSRRPSALLGSASSGNLLQQLSAGVVNTYQNILKS
ncbi:unnamed protein product, partial [Meganyctiphanes norvegica]